MNVKSETGMEEELLLLQLTGKKAKSTDEDAENEHMTALETYNEYFPSKLKIGKPHPDPVVETASLASVEPPDVWYRLSIPESTVESGQLSALQLESITYASQQHECFLPDSNRAGFLIGDGAGVGKGRTIAGVIFENYLKGRKKSIWEKAIVRLIGWELSV